MRARLATRRRKTAANLRANLRAFWQAQVRGANYTVCHVAFRYYVRRVHTSHTPHAYPRRVGHAVHAGPCILRRASSAASHGPVRGTACCANMFFSGAGATREESNLLDEFLQLDEAAAGGAAWLLDDVIGDPTGGSGSHQTRGSAHCRFPRWTTAARFTRPRPRPRPMRGAVWTGSTPRAAPPARSRRPPRRSRMLCSPSPAARALTAAGAASTSCVRRCCLRLNGTAPLLAKLQRMRWG